MLLHLQGIDRSASSALSHANAGGGGPGGQSSLSPPQQAAVRELLIAAHSNLSLGLLKVRRVAEGTAAAHSPCRERSSSALWRRCPKRSLSAPVT